jgi:hypothetical protein
MNRMTLQRHAATLVLEGRTTIEEAIRVGAQVDMVDAPANDDDEDPHRPASAVAVPSEQAASRRVPALARA